MAARGRSRGGAQFRTLSGEGQARTGICTVRRGHGVTVRIAMAKPRPTRSRIEVRVPRIKLRMYKQAATMHGCALSAWIRLACNAFLPNAVVAPRRRRA